MFPRAKPFFKTIAVLVVVGFVIIGALNLILQTSPARQIIQTTIEHSLGTPILLGSITATPLGGVKVTGISAGEVNSRSHLSIDSLILYPRYFRLLHGKVEIGSLELQHPVAQYSLVSKKKLPPVATTQPNLIVSTPVQAIQPQPALPPSSVTADLSQKPQTSSSASSSETIIQDPPHLKITDGEFTLLTIADLPIIAISKLNLSECPICDGALNGSITVSRIVLGRSLILHDLTSRVNLSPETHTLSLSKFTATLAQGKLTGDFSILLPPETTSYQSQLTLSGASLSQFFLDASLGNWASEGIINGNLNLSGIAGTPQSMEGNGSLICSNAVIQPADFLRQIGQILSVQELQQLRLSEGKILFRIHHGEARIDELTLHSENLILTANGPVNDQGNLDLQARLLFNEQLTGRLKGLLGKQLTQAPEPGFTQIAFHVTGPAQSPKTDLLERLTGIHINGDLGGFLQGIFGHH